MALWKFTNFNKYGNPRTRIMFRPDGEGFSHGPGFGPTMVSRFQYEVKGGNIPPSILELNGKTYIMPWWKEVEPETTLKDINWIQPKPKVKKQPIIETNISGSGLGEYKTKYYPESGKIHCSCPGFWRSGGNCKHVKALKLKLGL